MIKMDSCWGRGLGHFRELKVSQPIPDGILYVGFNINIRV